MYGFGNPKEKECTVPAITIIEKPDIFGITSEARAELVGLEVMTTFPPTFIHAGRQGEILRPNLSFSNSAGFSVTVVGLVNACRHAGKNKAEKELSDQFQLDDIVIFSRILCQEQSVM